MAVGVGSFIFSYLAEVLCSEAIEYVELACFRRSFWEEFTAVSAPAVVVLESGVSDRSVSRV